MRSLTLLPHLLNLARVGNDLKTAAGAFCDSRGSLGSSGQLPQGGCAHHGVLTRLLGGFGREEPDGESNLNPLALVVAASDPSYVLLRNEGGISCGLKPPVKGKKSPHRCSAAHPRVFSPPGCSAAGPRLFEGKTFREFRASRASGLAPCAG